MTATPCAHCGAIPICMAGDTFTFIACSAKCKHAKSTNSWEYWTIEQRSILNERKLQCLEDLLAAPQCCTFIKG